MMVALATTVFVAMATTVQMLLTSAPFHECPPSGYPSRDVINQDDQAQWSSTRPGTRLDEGVEQPVILARLRVPLHGQPEP